MAVIEYVDLDTPPLPLGPEMQALADAAEPEPDSGEGD